MTKVRNDNLPQHHGDQGHYGYIPIEMMPPADGQISGSMMVWDGNEAWYFDTVPGVSGSFSGDHDDLTNVTPDQHHDEDHAVRHEDGGADEILVEDLATGETDEDKFLGNDGAGALEWKVVSGSSGGSGVSWTQTVNESGASFSNFTTITGTWASNGTIIQQTGTPSAATKQARYNTIQPFGWGVIVEAEVRLPTTGQGAGANIQAKLVLGDTSTGGGGGLAVVLDRGQNNAQLERYTVAQLRTFTQTVNLDTWYKVRMVQSNRWTSVYVDGTLLGTGRAEVSQEGADYFLLSTYNALVDFRNIKLWLLTGSAPA